MKTTSTALPMLLTLLIVSSVAAVNGGGATPCEFDGRQGAVSVKNDALYPIRVRLVHADTNNYYPDGKHFWELKPGETKTIIENVGNDWGVRIGSSKIKCVGNAGIWDHGTRTFRVSTSSFHF